MGATLWHGRMLSLLIGLWVSTVSPFYLSAEERPATIADPVNAEEAYEIGLEAYIYFYPLVMMDITRRQATTTLTGNGQLSAPMNAFVHARAFAAPGVEGSRPNVNTL